MNHQEILTKTEQYISEKFKNEFSGHDWQHVNRVRKMALHIAKNENCNLFVTEMAALLHDLDDWKLKADDSEINSLSKDWLSKMNVDKQTASQILSVIDTVSFKGAGVETKPKTIEAAIVQDADRLDAIGAIGIARTFAYGGSKNRAIYDPEIKYEMHKDFDSYKKGTGPTINHFFEKLLLLKDRMNTQTAVIIAEKRHIFMENFLEQFFKECET